MKDVLEQLADDLEDARNDEGFCPSVKQSDDSTKYCPISEVKCEHRGSLTELMVDDMIESCYRCNYKPVKERDK